MPNGLSIGLAFPLLAPDGSAAAPSYSFASSPTSGMYLASVGVLGFSGAATFSSNVTATGVLTIGGTKTLTKVGADLVVSDSVDLYARLAAYGIHDTNAACAIGDSEGGISGCVLGPDSALSWRSASALAGTTVLSLYRDAADILALRRGANAQTYRLYNTYTDASNFERFSVSFSGGDVQLRQEFAGTGSVRALYFGNTTLGNVFGLGTAGGLLWVTDNTYDIGASGGSRPRNVYAGSYFWCQVDGGFVNSTLNAGLYFKSADAGQPRLYAGGTGKGLYLGGDPSATPVAQTFTIGEASRPGTDLNVAGSNGTIRSGLGTGNAAGSSLIFQTPDPIASSTVAQTYGQRLSLSALGATFDIPDQSFRINNQVSGAGASTGTLLNAPAAGNPTFWCPINLGGTVRYFPCW